MSRVFALKLSLASLALCFMANVAGAAHPITIRTLDSETNEPLVGVQVTVEHRGFATQTLFTDNNGSCIAMAETGVMISINARMDTDLGRGRARRQYFVPAYNATVNIPMQITWTAQQTRTLTFIAIDATNGAAIPGVIFIVTKEGFGPQSTVGHSVSVTANVGTEINVEAIKGGQNGYLPAEVNYLMPQNDAVVQILMTPQ